MLDVMLNVIAEQGYGIRIITADWKSASNDIFPDSENQRQLCVILRLNNKQPLGIHEVKGMHFPVGFAINHEFLIHSAEQIVLNVALFYQTDQLRRFLQKQIFVRISRLLQTLARFYEFTDLLVVLSCDSWMETNVVLCFPLFLF